MFMNIQSVLGEQIFFPYHDHCVLSMDSGVPCPAGGDAGDHQAAGGGPISCPTPQRPL